MADLIDREALLKELATHFNKVDGKTLYHPSMSLAMHDVRNAPAVDAVEVVRCKDCEHGIKDDDGLYQCILGAEYDEETGMYFGFNAWYTEDFFCAHGERRKENAD